MNIRYGIMEMIEQAKRSLVPVDDTSNLYTDLGLDSLSFIRLLVRIEEAYLVTFELMEMEACLRVDRLIALVESKAEPALAALSAGSEGVPDEVVSED